MQEASLSVFSLTIKKQRLRGMVPEVMWIRDTAVFTRICSRSWMQNVWMTIWSSWQKR